MASVDFLIRAWTDFFGEKVAEKPQKEVYSGYMLFGPIFQNWGVKQSVTLLHPLQTEQTLLFIYKGELQKLKKLHILQCYTHFHTHLSEISQKYLETRGSQTKRALATYFFEGNLTDNELATKICIENARPIRARLQDNIEPKTTTKPAEYGLTSKAFIDEKNKYQQWLEEKIVAEENESKRQEQENLNQLHKGENPLAGTLKAPLAAQFLRGDYAVTLDFAEIAEENPDLAEAILDEPEQTLKIGEQALKTFDVKTTDDLRILLHNPPRSSETSLREVRAKHHKKLLTIIIEPESVSDVRPICRVARFECPECGQVAAVLQNEDRFVEARGCGCGRKGKLSLVGKEMKDFAVIGVTQPLGEVLGGQGKRAQMKMHVEGVLASPERMRLITPGVPLRVVGYPTEVPTFLKGGKQSNRFDLVLSAVWFEPVEDYSFNLEFTEEEVESFRTAVAEEGFFERLAEACYPSHHGDAHVKQALVLQMLRGSFDRRVDEENLNILISGDPGTGKSRNFLRRTTELAPIARFVQATNSTSAGLLGSASTKDADSGRFVYEPGALPRAHRGVIVIDEVAALLPEEMKALNESLEEGSITIDKATLHLVVPSDVACLAAGNPVGGRFSEHEYVSGELLGIESSTLDRFDLVYVLVDTPDEARDALVVERMNVSAGFGGESVVSPWGDEWLRRFLLFARFSVHPFLRGVEASSLKDFYVGMRQSGRGEGRLAVSPRQYRSLRALSLLCAKLHLRSETSHSDVVRSIALLEPMLRSFGFDLARLSLSTPKSVFGLDSLLRVVEGGDDGRGVEFLQLRGSGGLGDDSLMALVRRGVKEGCLFEVTPGRWKVV